LKLAVAGDAVLRAIVDRLLVEPSSAAEIAVELGLDAQAVRRRLRTLVGAALVERGVKTRRRGISEYLYAADPNQTALWDAELSGLAPGGAEASVARVLRALFGEAAAAIDSGTYVARPEYAALRLPLPLDEPGWRQARLIHERLFGSIVEATERARGRLSCEGAEPIGVVSGILLFATPGSRWPRPFTAADPLPEPIRRRSNTRRFDTVGALADPLREKLVDALTLSPLGAGDLAQAIGAPVERIRYELRALERSGMTRVDSRRERRGAMEKILVAENRNMIILTEDVPAADEARSPADGIADSLRIIFRNVVEAVRGGSFRTGGGWYVARSPLRLDPEGFREVSCLMDTTVERLFDLREECLARRREGAPIRPAISELMLFEKADPLLERF
jgi:DNA-binding transcriptional ArsR family regulator